MKTIHIMEGSGRGSGRVESGQTFCRQSRVGSGQRFGGSGRVGSKKSDPWTTLIQHNEDGQRIPGDLGGWDLFWKFPVHL